MSLKLAPVQFVKRTYKRENYCHSCSKNTPHKWYVDCKVDNILSERLIRGQLTVRHIRYSNAYFAKYRKVCNRLSAIEVRLIKSIYIPGIDRPLLVGRLSPSHLNTVN
jgi:hypothetical protein